ncbi:NAD(P)-binding protein [Cristinia sonorae]|uniref:NAD(P)-binding protein n=1 Tax=Cristinia sonorae TaxID=1940300 RepID=A0A8K0UMH1_9AGAR|nr:NAD(P)-binding protein [Cristinia sonorae]
MPVTAFKLITKKGDVAHRHGDVIAGGLPSSTEPKDLVLVTGASGYLGAHVIEQLVKAEYRARGTVRSTKLATSRDAFSVYGDDVEIVGLDDLAGGDFSDVLKDVDAVIHVAAPISEDNAEQALKVAVDGSLNILRQAEKHGIKNFAYASSIVALSTAFLRGDYSPLKGDEWFPITKEEVLNGKDVDPYTIYIAEKVLSEKAVWEFAEQHPHIELTTVNPPFFYGPFAPGYRTPHETNTVSMSSMSTMSVFWDLLDPTAVSLPSTAFVKTSETSPSPSSQPSPNRWVEPSEMVRLVERERPELVGRISKVVERVGVRSVVDLGRLKEVLGVEVRPWQQTVLDGVDALIDLEKEWEQRGAKLSRA